jgi:hypothetical protein
MGFSGKRLESPPRGLLGHSAGPVEFSEFNRRMRFAGDLRYALIEFIPKYLAKILRPSWRL